MCRPPAPRRTGRLWTRTRLSTEVSVARAAELAPPPAMPFAESPDQSLVHELPELIQVRHGEGALHHIVVVTSSPPG
jgi:hypothetical protein